MGFSCTEGSNPSLSAMLAGAPLLLKKSEVEVEVVDDEDP
jgi:hypothetical protein